MLNQILKSVEMINISDFSSEKDKLDDKCKSLNSLKAKFLSFNFKKHFAVQ